ncbi:MAG TPA: heme biosynthesis HemY N-terminal domain-containing protein [Geminicoccaceae bacterium]|nr:heme biosynthesis HemY N-terminal domain-containing protein [Geminicoccaceae bacterium]
MLRLILFLLVAVAAALFAVWLAEQPGEMVVVWGRQEVRTSLAVMVAGLVALAALAVLLFELLRWTGSVPRRLGERRRRSRERRGLDALSNGLIAVAAGDVGRARYLTRQAERLLPQEPAVLLLAAQTAQLEGHDDAAHRRFRAMLRRPETELLGLRGLLAGAAKGREHEQALELARRAHRRSPTTPWVLTTLFDLLVRAERWEEAQPVLDGIAGQRLWEEEPVRRRRAILWHMAARQRRQQDDLAAAQRLNRKASKLKADFVPAAVLASDLALAQGHVRHARRVLEAAWLVEPHPELARAYMQLVPGETPTQRLERFQRLERLRAAHPETQIVLAELAIAARQWDAARRHLERAMEPGPTQRACRLMAELERASSGPGPQVQEWLARAVEARPDRAWVCEDTGDVLLAWAPFGSSGAFDTGRWAEPPKVMALLPDRRSTFVLIESEPEAPAPDRPRPAPAAPQEAAAAAG